MTAPELKPCPFCGGEADAFDGIVYCSLCSCRLPQGFGYEGEGNGFATDYEAISAWNRRADLSAVPAQVRVKPLVWEVFQSKYEGRQHYGRGVFGHWYGVSRQKYGSWDCIHFIDGRRVDLGTNPTIEAAKAAAQADYEARILAAIEPQPDPRDEVIALAITTCRIIDDAVKEGYDTVNGLMMHLLEAVEPARAALAAAKAVQK